MKKFISIILSICIMSSVLSISTLGVGAANNVSAYTIVNNAESMIDKYPYVWGGESPEEGGFDCSGFVWYVYNKMSGVNISLSQAGRSKSALASAGTKITSISNFLPGDIVQFDYPHVAIYIGNNTIIEAQKRGTRIKYRNINSNSQVAYAIRLSSVTQERGSYTPSPTPAPTPSVPATISLSKSSLNLDLSSKPTDTINIDLSGDLPSRYNLSFESESNIIHSWGGWTNNDRSEKLTITATESTKNGTKVTMYLKDANTGNVCATKTFTIYVTKPVVKKTVKLYFEPYGGSDAPQTQIVETNSTVYIPSQTPYRSGYTFLGWDSDYRASSARYRSGDAISIRDTDFVLYAVWEEIDYDFSLTFDEHVTTTSEYHTIQYRINGDRDLIAKIEFDCDRNIDCSYGSGMHEDGNYYLQLHFEKNGEIIDNDVTVRLLDKYGYNFLQEELTVFKFDNAINQKCGDNAYWDFDNGVLTISGTGKMNDYSSPWELPWYDIQSDVRKIVIEEGITYIGNNAFCWHGANGNIDEIYIPSTVEGLGNCTFAYVDGVDTVYYNARDCEFTGTSLTFAYNYFARGTKLVIGEDVERIGANVFFRGQFDEVVCIGDWNTISTDMTGNEVLECIETENNDGEIVVKVDGRKVKFDQPPIIQDGRTLVPVRAACEAMGINVQWIEAEQRVILTKYGEEFDMQIGNKKYWMNQVSFHYFDVPPQIINGRTLLPIRAIAQFFGYDVDWNGNTQTVIIES